MEEGLVRIQINSLLGIDHKYSSESLGKNSIFLSPQIATINKSPSLLNHPQNILIELATAPYRVNAVNEKLKDAQIYVILIAATRVVSGVGNFWVSS